MTREPVICGKDDLTQSVREFVSGYFAALADGNLSRVDAMLAPCFQIVRGDGTALDRFEFLERSLPKVRSQPVIRNLVVTSSGDLLVGSLLLDIEQSIDGRIMQSGARQLVTIQRAVSGWQFVSVANLACPRTEA